MATTTQNNQRLDWLPNSALASLPTVSSSNYRGGLRHFAIGVTLVSTCHNGVRAGLTATAVCSVTAEPPRLVVFVNKNVAACDLIFQSGALCINVLATEQEELAKAFASMIPGVQGEARFNYGTWDTAVTGVPVLQNALANFDCRVVKVFEESTHQAFLCEVLATRERSDGDALIYLNGAFRGLPQ